jgi:hypothetical protein
MTHLVPTDYMHETSLETSSATDLKFTTRRKPTWEPLLPLKITLKILQRSDVSKPTFASPLLRSRKEVLDTAGPQQVPTPGVDWNVLANDVVARVPSIQWLKRDEVKTKWYSRSILLLTLQLMLQPTLWLMLQQTLRPMWLAMPLTMQPMLPTSRETSLQTQDTMQELSLL